MPTVAFEASAAGPAMTVDVPAGGPLVDLCDDARAPVAFSCRAATCGTCRVEVLAGMDRLDRPREDERDLLDLLGAPPAQRLACQAALLPGVGLIRLRWAGHRP
jgi:ferredoxin